MQCAVQRGVPPLQLKHKLTVRVVQIVLQINLACVVHNMRLELDRELLRVLERALEPGQLNITIELVQQIQL